VDRLPPHLDVDTVAIDNEEAAVAASSHLITLGHRDVLVVASTLKLANVRARLSGIRRAFKKSGLPAPKVVEAGLTLETASDRLAAWFDANDHPTGIIALTNFTTIAVIASLARLEIRMPGDISLVGFDDYIWMQAATPTITAIRQPVEQLGAQAWICLRERIEEGRTKPRTVRLHCSLQVRGSTSLAANSSDRDSSGSRAKAVA
jgi:LacI family transcriptional regulator